jgi:enoyl-CoA hydratase/carnithine racemase
MEGKWGLIPDMGGNLALRELVTRDIALKLAMSAEVISAQTAMEYGLITSISGDPLQKARQLAQQISERSPDAVAAVKKLYRQNWFKADRRMLAMESLYQVRILLGKNQNRTVKRQLSPEKSIAYEERGRW